MKIIPAIDIIGGKCVRLTQGDYSRKKEYNSNPLEVAKAFEGAGVKQLHLVDLDGAKEKHIVNHKVLETIANQTSLKIDFGGGLQSNEDLKIAFDSGASQITGGSIAVKNEVLFLNWLELYGAEKIILGADCKEEKIAISGWLETSEYLVYDFVEKFAERGLKYVISTDVAKDGAMLGPSFDLYANLNKIKGTKIIASGGVRNMADLEQLKVMGVYGAIIGKSFYEGNITLQDLEKYHVD